MNRRAFVSGSLGIATIARLPAPPRAAQSTQSASETTAELLALT